MSWFKKFKEDADKKYAEALLASDSNENAEEETTAETEPEMKVEEWIWVEGYKGTDKDMKCYNDFQYELGKQYDMPDDAEIETCSSGFHLCLNMPDVTSYVRIGNGNRFFKVLALVRKSDLEEYGTTKAIDGPRYYRTRYYTIDKLAARSIKFIQELSMDEILEHTTARNWDTKYREIAITAGLNAAEAVMHSDELLGYGYSFPFAQWLINNKKYDIAKAVGSQSELSMDMKVFMIMSN